MKKYLVIAMFAIAAIGFIGCSESDETVADIRWTNTGGGDSLHDIKWVGSKGSQTWNESASNALPVGSTNDYKGVYDLTGEGQCLDSGGADFTINVQGDPDGGAYTVTENSSSTLVIDSLAKK